MNNNNSNSQSPPALGEVVEQLCGSYQDANLALNHLHESVLPSRQEALKILSDIKDLLFPDYRLDHQVRSRLSGYLVGGILERIHEDLSRQIYLAISYTLKDQASGTSMKKQAEDATYRFITRLPALREALSYDVQAALDGDPAAHSNDEIIFCYPGFEAITTYRIAHELYILGVPLLPRIMTENAHSRTGTDIHPGAQIGRSFFIDHATGVVIGETTVIGQRVKLYQGVTLGALSFPKDAQGKLMKGTKRHPTLEDDVVIYAGATVLGGDTIIGAGSVIGGNCWVTHSLPPGTKVMLQEPQMKFRGPQPVVAEPDWVI